MGITSAARAARARASGLGSRRMMIALYGAVVFLYWLSLYLYVPTLPTYAQSKADNLALVGVILSMYGLWQAVIRFPLGIAADWLGWRKPFIIVGLALAGLGAWVMGAAGDVNQLIVGRAITGLAAGAWVPLVVAFSGLFPPEEAVRASALLTLFGSAGRMLATGVTGTLNGLGGYSLAFNLSVGSAVLAVLIVLAASEKRNPPKRPSLSGIGSIITRRDVLLPSLLNTVSQYANWAATFGFVPVLARQLGATDVTQSILVSMNIAVLTIGNLFTTTLVKRFGAQRLVYLSFVLLAAGVAGSAVALSLPILFVAQMCIGLSQGIGGPVLMGLSIERVDDAQRTTAMGLHQAVYAIGMFGGPSLSGVLALKMGVRPMFGVTAFVCLVLGLAGTRWLTRQRSGPGRA